MYFDPLYLLFAAPGMLLAFWAQWKVKSTFSRFSKVTAERGWSGAEIAEAILRVNQIHDVRVEPTQGFLGDHYDPTNKVLRLSPDVYSGRSVSAAGVAAHEVGHAIQHATGYRWLMMRTRMVPVLSVTSNLAMPAILIGFVLMAMGQAGLGQLAVLVGAGLFAILVVFQLVTLPVEFDASRRALLAIEQGGLVTAVEHQGAKKVLTAAALTYIAAAVASMLQLLYFLYRAGLFGGSRGK